MRFDKLEIPDELINDQIDGKLVIFAGAGISKGAPSNLPGYEDLAKELGRGILDFKRPVDRYLGELEKKTIIREKIVKKYNNPESKYSPIHKDILSLFSSEKDVRVVTTNWDGHFSVAAKELYKTEIETFYAPALPLGKDFSGIVYLHGHVKKKQRDLVITDLDFGKAYLTEGWATRFLNEMFQHYTVIFIGYSHDDVIMKYLSRGLAPDTKRFAIDKEGKEEEWRFLGIEPISFPIAPSDKYKELKEGISKWANNSQMGILDREQKIKSIVESPRIYNSENESFIKSSLKKLVTVKCFIKYAKSTEWLEFAEKEGVFKPLFTPSETLDEISVQFGWWFSQSYVCQYPHEALALIKRQEGIIHPSLWRHIAHALEKDKNRETKFFSLWVIILLDSLIPDTQSHYLAFLLNSCRVPEDRISSLLMFNKLIKPRLKTNGISVRLYEDRAPQVEMDIKLEGDKHTIKDAWNTIFKPNLNLYANGLEEILTHNIQIAHYLFMACGNGDEYRDRLSYSRSAIESHEQDQYDDEFDVIIDASRDLMDYLLTNNAEEAHALINKWGNASPPLLKRLALYGITEHVKINVDDKITWLLNKKWLYVLGLKHEVFRLIKNAYPEATVPIKKRLLDTVNLGLDDAEQLLVGRDVNDYEIYNLLVWMNKNAPDCPLVKAELSSILKEHPEYEPREHPDFDHWISSFREEHDIDAEKLLALDVNKLVEMYITNEEERYSITALSKNNFDWSWKFFETLISRNEWDPSIWRPIFWGWSQSKYSFSEEEWAKVLSLFHDHIQLHSLAYNIADTLEHGIRADTHAIPKKLFPIAEEVASALFLHLEKEMGDVDKQSKDWATDAINHPGGLLSLFFLHKLSIEVKEKKEEKPKLPEKYKNYFNQFISGRSISAQIGCLVIVGHIHYLDALDSKWTRDTLIPLLNWSENSRKAQQSWHGYLAWGKWTQSLLSERLLQLYQDSFPLLSTKLTDVHSRFLQHLAAIALYADVNPMETGWLRNLHLHTEQDIWVEFAKTFGRELKPLKPSAILKVWKTWLSEYWSRRIEGEPFPLTPEESEVMISWIFNLEPVITEVVEKISEMQDIDFCDVHFYFMLKEENYHKTHPHELTNLLKYLLKNQKTPPHFYCRFIEELVEGLIEESKLSSDLLIICEKLGELGCEKALDLRERITKKCEADS